jgi:hypothetical protein
MTLLQILNNLLAFFGHHGAPNASVLSVGPHLGWLESKHWIVKICFRGSPGCHL